MCVGSTGNTYITLGRCAIAVIGSGRQDIHGDGTRNEHRQHLLADSGSAVAFLYFGGVGVIMGERNVFIRRGLLASDIWVNSWG